MEMRPVRSEQDRSAVEMLGEGRAGEEKQVLQTFLGSHKVRARNLQYRGYRKSAIAFYVFATSLKDVSSMKLHRDLGITDKTAWFMAHRIREAAEKNLAMFAGPAEADETYIGGKEKNKYSGKRHRKWSLTEGKSIVAGVRDRPTRTISPAVVERGDKETLQGFVSDRTEETATAYTDEGSAYRSLGEKRPHVSMAHKAGEFVRGDVTTSCTSTSTAMCGSSPAAKTSETWTPST